LSMLRKLFLISRPISWLNTAFPFAAGYIVSGGVINQSFILATVFFLIPYNLLMYGINDVFDYESDIRNPRKGGIEGMREQRTFHPTIIRASIILNVPFLVYLLAIGTTLSNIVLLALVFFVLAYSVAGLRFKEIPVVDSVTSSIHFVGPLIYALALTTSLKAAWVYLLAFFFWGMASHAFGAVQDIIPDREAKLNSIATFFGARNTVWFAMVLYIAASLIVASRGRELLPIACTGVIYVLNCLPFYQINDANSSITNRAWRRFIWLNMITGFIVTITLILHSLS